jgi:hypothetical protein
MVGASLLTTLVAASPLAQQGPSSQLQVAVTIARSCSIRTASPTATQFDVDALVSLACAKGANPAEPRVSLNRVATAGEPRTDAAAASAPADGATTAVVLINF